MQMVEQIKDFWHTQIPAWLPIVIAIAGGVFWLGQQQQSISDRLHSLEKQMEAVQEYLRTHDGQRGGVPLSQTTPLTLGPQMSTNPDMR